MGPFVLVFQALYRRMPTSETEYIKETIADELKPWAFQRVDSNYDKPKPYTLSRASRFSYPLNQGVYAAPSRPSVMPLQVVFEVEYQPIPDVSKPYKSNDESNQIFPNLHCSNRSDRTVILLQCECVAVIFRFQHMLCQF